MTRRLGELMDGSDEPLHTIRLDNGGMLYLIRQPSDDDKKGHRTATIELLPTGNVGGVRLYDEAASHKLADVGAGDLGFRHLGIGEDEWKLSGSCPPFESAEERENDAALQTKEEADAWNSPTTKAAIEGLFMPEKSPSCPANWHSQPTLYKYPLKDGRTVPCTLVTPDCVQGNVTNLIVFFAIPEIEQQHRLCTKTWITRDTRRVTLSQVRKSSRLAFSFGLSLPAGGPARPPQKEKDATPKPGDDAYANGKPLKDSSGLGVKFDFELARTYVRTTVNIFRETFASGGEVVCV